MVVAPALNKGRFEDFVCHNDVRVLRLDCDPEWLYASLTPRTLRHRERAFRVAEAIFGQEI